MNLNLKLIGKSYNYLYNLFFKQLEQYEEYDRKSNILTPNRRFFK